MGHTDAVSCGYDDSDDTRGCPWQLAEGQITNAQGSGAANHLPSTDSDGNTFGNQLYQQLFQLLLFISLTSIPLFMLFKPHEKSIAHTLYFKT